MPDDSFYTITLRTLGILLGSCLLLTPARADESERDSIVTDRPDFVESSNVVGRGRVQLEMSVMSERSTPGGARVRVNATPLLLRVGVADTVELRLESDGYQVQRTTAAGARSTERGMADLSAGFKWHITDGDAAMPSLGLLAHVDLPSGATPFRERGMRPSLRIAAEWELPADMSLGIMPGLQSTHDDQGQRHVSGIFGIVLGKNWTDEFRTFAEVSTPTITSTRHGGTQATFDLGAAYLLNRHMQLDAAISRGLNRRTFDTSGRLDLLAI